MRHRHEMPFGAQLIGAGATRFRLWAPGAARVEVCLHLDRHQRPHVMADIGDGWHEFVTDAAPPGTRYDFRIPGAPPVPDPGSRMQAGDVHGPSVVVDPRTFDWRDDGWRGRPWHEAVIYELHVGTFTPEGTFAAIKNRLAYLRDLGVTAIELMPIADFPGKWNWGYDGVLPFAPDRRYGTPDDLKDLIQAAHAHGLMIFLDVVYNHFGPEGNYLHAYAPPFFTERHHTPWGAAINYDQAGSRIVRDFVIHNALYWLEEYQLDGLRLDAVHAIVDESFPDILTELAQHVRAGVGRARAVHLILENDRNAARYLARDAHGRALSYDAQWNDDIHHAFHVLLTGEHAGYYTDYAQAPLHDLGRCLAEGFAYQGEASPYRGGEARGEPSAELTPLAFVDFLQNHDQVGNRAFGERITALATSESVRAATAILLLAPSPPLLFMGQEWAADEPFPFFCDFGPDLANAVTAGRRKEFARFPAFAEPAARERIPDPNAPATFSSAVLDWTALQQRTHTAWLSFHRELLALRVREIVPRLPHMHTGGHFEMLGATGLRVDWTLGDHSRLTLLANLGSDPIAAPRPAAQRLFALHPDAAQLPAWSVSWWLAAPASA